MELFNKVKSTVDKTVKYVFKLEDNLIIESTYIDNNTGKDIICIASQTMCAMGCTFCHLTDYLSKLKLRNLKHQEIVDSVNYICKDMNIGTGERPLLISYMGSGEPLLNLANVQESMLTFMSEYSNIRFGLSTMLPKEKWGTLFNMAQAVKKFKIPLKIHVSLHYTKDEQRNRMMPNATDIKATISALEFYKEITGNEVEVHYTLIKGENDTDEDGFNLVKLLDRRGIPIKFLRFNDKSTSPNKRTEMERISIFRKGLELRGVKTEYYEPPGKDVGASCGQFLFDQYEKNSELDGIISESLVK